MSKNISYALIIALYMVIGLICKHFFGFEYTVIWFLSLIIAWLIVYAQ